jgi:thioredoxin reductase
MYDLIVIGGGAAALSATAFALGKQLKVLMIYEKLGGKAGQQLTLRSDNDGGFDYLVGHILVHMSRGEDAPVGESQYAGEELVQLFERQIQARAGLALCDKVTMVSQEGEIFAVNTLSSGVQHGLAVIVATGVTPYPLAVPGARELLGQGLGYSATTHARRLAGKRVVVIGATTRSLRGAAELARTVDRLFLVTLDPIDMPPLILETLRAQPVVQVLEGYEVVALRGDKAIEEVVLDRGGQREVLAVDAAFVDLGLRPNSGVVRHLAAVDADGFIRVDARNATTVPGMFAAGDVTTMFGEQVLIAVGDGARAALSAYDYLLSLSLMQQLGGRD